VGEYLKDTTRGVVERIWLIVKHGELDELHRTIQRHGRQIDVTRRSERALKRH
jgi:hypothetical protein